MSSHSDKSNLYAMGFVAAFALVMATPAMAQKVISHTETVKTTGTPIVTQVTTPTATGTKTTTTTMTPTTTTTTYSIGSTDRTVLTKYLAEQYPTICPEGFASYRDTCLAPGEFKKSVSSRSYIVGEPLPTTVTVLPLPETVVTRLTPLPKGYSYGRADEDVFVYSTTDRRLIDRVTLYEVK